MTPDQATDLVRHALLLVILISGPVLIIGLLVGVLISIVQALTQIQEQTLTFVPKLAGIALVILLAGHWMLGETVAFTHSLFNMIPQLLQS